MIQLALTLVLAITGTVMIGTNTQADTWHKGIPTFMKGSFYRTKLLPKYFVLEGKRYKRNYANRYEGIKTSRTTMYFDGYQNGAVLKGCQYYHKGKYYIIKGRHSKYDFGIPAIKIKKINKKVVYANDGNIVKGKSSFLKLEKMTKIK